MGDATRRFKSWLLRKTHGLVGALRLDQRLAQISEEVRSAQAATNRLHAAAADALQTICRDASVVQTICHSAEALKTFSQTFDRSTQLSAENTALLSQVSRQLAELTQAGQSSLQRFADVANLGEESLRALETQGLFILGAARSGTTILTRSLNRAREILLLEEPDFFDNREIADFTAFFNAKHASMGNRCMKGTYVPPPLSPEAGPLGLLKRLAQDYRYVGAKTAIGPHPYPTGWQQTWLDFQSKYFQKGMYIYILRTPVESLWSMHKLFPQQPVARLFDAWLRAVALSLDAYHVFPNSRMVFFDDLGPSMIERLGQWLEARIPCLPGTFGRSYMDSALSAGDIPDVLRPYASLCRECTELYQDLYESFSRDEFVYSGGTTEWRYFTFKLLQIEDMLARLRPDSDADDRQLHRAA